LVSFKPQLQSSQFQSQSVSNRSSKLKKLLAIIL